LPAGPPINFVPSAREQGLTAMEVTETLNQGLKRELKVIVPAAELEQHLLERLKDLSQRVQIRGFRRGKVPVHHLRRVYGKSVMAEVVQQQLDDTSKKALADAALKPAYQPDMDLPEDTAEVENIMEGKADLAYTLKFEIVPPIELKDASEIELERWMVEVSDEEIDQTLERLKSQYKDFEPRPEGARAETGDRLTVSFVGRIDGEPFEGGTAEDVQIVLGSGTFLPGFEEQLTGAAAGDEVKVNVTFPEDYQVAELAGKPAAFDVKVNAVEAPKETAADDEFAKKLGVESLEKLREMLKERLAGEYANMAGMKLKREVLDALDKLYSLELPEKLVEAEFQQIWSALTREMERENKTFEQENTTEEAAREEYRRIAERRVKLGLVLGTVGEQAGVTVAEDEIERALLERARQFPGQEREVYEFYRKTPNAMMELRGPIFEQKVIENVIAGAKVSEKTVTREELAKALEDLDDSGHEHDHDHDHDHDHEHDHEHEHGHEQAAAADAPAKKPRKAPAKKKANPAES
jgi:trigger factor